MMLFGIYFPKRVETDRRWPWAKWLLIGPIILRSTQLAAANVLAGNHAVLAIAIERRWLFSGKMMIVNMLAISCFFAAIAHKSFSEKSRDARRRLFLLYGGTTISLTPLFFLGVANSILGRSPQDESPAIVFIVLVLLAVFPLTMAYVIVVERAMDVRVVIRQGVQYLLASRGLLVLQVFLSALVVAAAALSVNDADRPQGIWLIGIVLLCVFLIQQFAAKVRTWIDRRFFREAYDAEQILTELAAKVRTMVETGPLLEMVTHRISESLHIPRVAVLLNDGGAFEVSYAVGYSESPRVMILADSPNIEKTAKEQLGAELVLPLSLNQKVLGVLSLGPKRSEEPYSKADVRLLGSVATQTGLALENSRLTAEVAAEVAHRERMNREIEIAREVQERLFPQELPQFSGIQYAGTCRPALGVGGDYYDFILVSCLAGRRQKPWRPIR